MTPAPSLSRFAQRAPDRPRARKDSATLKKKYPGISPAFMALQAFDQETRWPGKERLPASFDPRLWLERARDPGLGLSRLREAGVTGAGVSVAILIRVNASLPAAERIRVVSISDGIGASYRKEWNAALGKLKKAGIAVVYSAGGVLSGFSYGGCPPTLDRDDHSNYSRSPRFAGPQRGRVVIPADFRATASNAGDGEKVVAPEAFIAEVRKRR